MSKLLVVPLLCLLVTLPSVVTVSPGARVLAGHVITIPPNLSPPCNAAHPENCPKPVYTNSTRHCNEANRCRSHLLFLLDGSATRFLVRLFVEGTSVNLANELLKNAIIDAFYRWLASTSATKNGLSVEKGASFSPSGNITISVGLRDELIINLSTTVKDLGIADVKEIVYRIRFIFEKLWVERQKKGGVNGGHKEGSSPKP